SPDAKHSVLFNYLKVGLENGEAGVYVASDENPSQIREAMKRFGVNVEKYEKTGALQVFGYEDIYIRDGKFNVNTTINLWNKLYNEALTKGFKGCRVTGEMACFFEHNLVQELVEYERALHRVLDIPIIAICAYNANMLIKASNPMDLYNELLKAHGTVLFTGVDNKLGRIQIRQA
ncbi:MAG: MEDS domain-containing protein, partial [Candidatus Bathyarchaeia archaeon]